jgi:hypothetical protein
LLPIFTPVTIHVNSPLNHNILLHNIPSKKAPEGAFLISN